jgi:hypothetical protein
MLLRDILVLFHILKIIKDHTHPDLHPLVILVFRYLFELLVASINPELFQKHRMFETCRDVQKNIKICDIFAVEVRGYQQFERVINQPSY